MRPPTSTGPSCSHCMHVSICFKSFSYIRLYSIYAVSVSATVLYTHPYLFKVSVTLLHIISTLFVIDNLSDLQGPVCMHQAVM